MPTTTKAHRKESGDGKAQARRRYRVLIGCPNRYCGQFRPEAVDDLPTDLEDVETLEECDSIGEAVAKARRFNETMMVLDKWSSEAIPAWCLVAVPLSEVGAEHGD